MTGAHRVVALLAALALPGACLAAQPCATPRPATVVAPSPGVLPADLMDQAAHVNTYPTFCSIPPIPKDVRTAGAYKAAVVDTRVAGVTLQRQSAPSTFSLSGTDDFAADATSEAAPPPPMTGPDDAGTEAFTNEMRAKATPPPRPH